MRSGFIACVGCACRTLGIPWFFREFRQGIFHFGFRALSHEDAIHEVLSKTMQKPVIDKMIQMDAVRRLAFMGEGGEPVG